MTLRPDAILGDVVSIRYRRPGVRDADFEHPFDAFPEAFYDSERKVLVLVGVEAGPV